MPERAQSMDESGRGSIGVGLATPKYRELIGFTSRIHFYRKLDYSLHARSDSRYCVRCQPQKGSEEPKKEACGPELAETRD